MTVPPHFVILTDEEMAIAREFMETCLHDPMFSWVFQKSAMGYWQGEADDCHMGICGAAGICKAMGMVFPSRPLISNWAYGPDGPHKTASGEPGPGVRLGPDGIVIDTGWTTIHAKTIKQPGHRYFKKVIPNTPADGTLVAEHAAVALALNLPIVLDKMAVLKMEGWTDRHRFEQHSSIWKPCPRRPAMNFFTASLYPIESLIALHKAKVSVSV
jgi:hypothetical protein